MPQTLYGPKETVEGLEVYSDPTFVEFTGRAGFRYRILFSVFQNSI
jgi:hypothetical protein